MSDRTSELAVQRVVTGLHVAVGVSVDRTACEMQAATGRKLPHAALLVCPVVLLVFGFAAAALGQNPEDRRLDPAEFRQGLRARGLTELLELYLEDVPPIDDDEHLLLRREINLARFADASRSPADRRAALLEANRTLETLINQRSDAPRSFDWRTELVRSLLYQEAELYYSRILLRGGTVEDRRKLAGVMERALHWCEVQREALEQERARLELVPALVYERLELSGHVERIETLKPRLDYLERWSTFYRGLARDPQDPRRIEEFSRVLEESQTQSGLLESPHSATHAQAQSLLLAGMAARRVGRDVWATEYLNRAYGVVRSITDATESEALRWVANLALLEGIRVHAESRRFEQSERALERMSTYLGATAPDDFGLHLAHALAESDVRRAQSRHAAVSGDTGSARHYRNMWFESLQRLARRRADYRDEVYAAVYERMPAGADVADLHAFEACALVASSLSEAAELDDAVAAARVGEASPTETEALEARRSAALKRAVSVARLFTDLAGQVPAELLPELAFNLAVAQLRSGHPQEAVRAFLRVARDYPRFPQAGAAAIVAVQEAAKLAESPSLRSREEIQELYLEALQVLTTGYSHTEDARYWRFFLAQLLHDLGRYHEAAAAFSQVHAEHEYRAHAVVLRIRSMASALGARADNDEGLVPEAMAVLDAVDQAARRMVSEPALADRPSELVGFLAEAELLAAEALLSAGRVQAEQALTRLQSFEQRYPEQGRLLGRVLRVRIVALEQLGRLVEAERTLPEYVRRDPENAGATLQALFESLRAEVERLREGGEEELADRKAASALLLAEQIQAWVSADPSRAGEGQKAAVGLQLAWALLQAKHYAEAERAFSSCLDPAKPPDIQAIFGHAEVLYRLERYADALPLFNRVLAASPPDQPLRFRALLRDLQCRTSLGHPPEGIISVIRQQKYLHDDMGGPKLRREFDVLHRRNQDRLP
ncbi:MAG: tetratricopeptide repeat protein [bacterium]|nr:tetratricopeptide repeat protein [bacterium]